MVDLKKVDLIVNDLEKETKNIKQIGSLINKLNENQVLFSENLKLLDEYNNFNNKIKIDIENSIEILNKTIKTSKTNHLEIVKKYDQFKIEINKQISDINKENQSFISTYLNKNKIDIENIILSKTNDLKNIQDKLMNKFIELESSFYKKISVFENNIIQTIQKHINLNQKHQNKINVLIILLLIFIFGFNIFSYLKL